MYLYNRPSNRSVLLDFAQFGTEYIDSENRLINICMKQPYRVARQVVSEDTLDLLKNTILLTRTVDYYQQGIDSANVTAFGDEQSPISFAFYSNLICDSLAVTLLPLMEELTGLELWPTYTYGRIYWAGSTLAAHRDRPSCEYSATLCIATDPEPWPIYMAGEEILLEAGDIAVYRGCDVEHWRKPYTGRQQIQLFLHYVDANGIYKDYKFDQRPILGIKKT